MRRLEERKGRRPGALLRVKWSLVLLGVGVLIGLAAVLDPLLAPLLGGFNVQAALVAGGLFVVVGYMVATILRLIGR